MKPVTVKLHAGIGGFAGDKDEAKKLRMETILPAFHDGKEVILDFSEVKYSTQSFVHALLGEVLQRFCEPALDKLEFKNYSPQVKSLVQLVVDYSLGGFQKDNPITVGTADVKEKKSASATKKSPSTHSVTSKGKH